MSEITLKANQNKSSVLKVAIFATGLSGIVAEYSLATLANYFLGNAVFQWAMIISVMMFSMGIGSQISRSFSKNLLDKFIGIEFILSAFTSFAPLIIYGTSAYLNLTGPLIYSLCVIIGVLIGMEIPLVARINDEYEELRENIANVMALDYFGSLVGGIFFSFVGLRYLGMTYTPFVFGSVNLIVAITLILKFRKLVHPKNLKYIISIGVVVVVSFFTLLATAKKFEYYSEKTRYKENIIFAQKTKQHKVVITEYRDQYMYFLDRNLSVCTRDEHMYYEPFVHPVMQMYGTPTRVLVIGGSNGFAVREILKYASVKEIVVVNDDMELLQLGRTNEIYKKYNKGALSDPKVNLVEASAFNYLDTEKKAFDIIIADVQDPNNEKNSQLFTFDFYKKCKEKLSSGGFIITQALNPLVSFKANTCIQKTLHASGFNTLSIHNHVLSLGEMGFVIGSISQTEKEIKQKIETLKYKVKTKWLTDDIGGMLTSFGKLKFDKTEILINYNRNHILVTYFKNKAFDKLSDWRNTVSTNENDTLNPTNKEN